MCGITGIINRNQRSIEDKHVITGMLNRIKHRGPDDTGICGIDTTNTLHSKNSIEEIYSPLWAIMGFNRLSIQDISYAGHQPMISKNNKVALTFNGEIYNVNFLREELKKKGYTFVGRSDTEVILNLYLEYGFEAAIKKLNGMFGIALYDSEANSFYFSRDRFGIIPLSIYVSEEYIIYGSEIKSFLECPFFKRKVNLNSVLLNLEYEFANDSIFEDVHNIEPGTILEYNPKTNKLSKYSYFNLDEYSQTDYHPQNNYIEELNETLYKSVGNQLISDVNLGVQLSGGVDSTLLAHYVSDYFKKDSRVLYGFSMTNHDSPSYDEEKYIDYAASFNDIRLHKVDMCFDSFINGVEKSIYAYEKPFYSLPCVGVYLFSKLAKQKVTVLISGEGADEIGGGYYENFVKYEELKDYFNKGAYPKDLARYDSVNGSPEFIKYFSKIRAVESYTDLNFSGDLTTFLEDRQNYWNSLHGTPFDKVRKMHFKYRLVSMLERQNKICMANAVENRVPFLDNDVVKLLFTMPEQLMMSTNSGNLQGKYIIKKLNGKIYSDEFAFRKKQAIHVPLFKYLNNPKMQEYLKNEVYPSMQKRGLVNMNGLKNLLLDLSNPQNMVSVWKYITMELWMQYFVDGKTTFYSK